MQRYTATAFPPYSYVPGLHPHPRSSPDGHAHGLPEPTVDEFSTDSWHRSEPYLFACDLFNAGFFWESHELWEAVWHCVGRAGPLAELQKALIKLAAAGVKGLERRPEGVRRHLRRADQLLAGLLTQGGAHMCGVDLAELQAVVLGRLAAAEQLGEDDSFELGMKLRLVFPVC